MANWPERAVLNDHGNTTSEQRDHQNIARASRLIHQALWREHPSIMQHLNASKPS